MFLNLVIDKFLCYTKICLITKMKVMVIYLKKILSVFVLLAVLAGGYFAYGKYIKDDLGESQKTLSVTSEITPDTEVTEITEPSEEFVPEVVMECSNNDVYKGELILVNRDFSYHDNGNNPLVNIYTQKNEFYQVNSTEMFLSPVMIDAINEMLSDFYTATGINNILANSGYRSIATQDAMYQADLAATGMETSQLVAPPGKSEHHTGLAMDFAINDGEYYPAVRNEGAYTWIYDNAEKYGMILRYTEENKNITGYEAESWHFRYIGKPHASIVKKTGMAYEQYIWFLKDFSFEEPLEYKYSDTEFYKIYYVQENYEGTMTNIPIPYEAFSSSEPDAYKISGNNMDGFVVTVKVKELSENYNEDILNSYMAELQNSQSEPEVLE